MIKLLVSGKISYNIMKPFLIVTFFLFGAYWLYLFVLAYSPKSENIVKTAQYSYTQPTRIPFSESRLWNLINDWQIKQGWKPYIEHQKLCEITEKRLIEVKNDWSHSQFKKHWTEIDYLDLGENLAKDFSTEEQMLESWLNSPTHLANLTKYHTYSCLRCDGSRCVQMFVNI